MVVAENFMLLALGGEDGKPLIGNLQLECGLAAAALVELARAGRIDIDGANVVVRDATPLGNAEEDVALARIAAEEAHDLQWWVGTLRRGLAEGFLGRLVARGVVSEEHVRRMGIFSEVRHHLADEALSRQLRECLAGLLQGGAADPDALVLLSIVHATGLGDVILPGTDAAEVERRIADVGSDTVGDAVSKVIGNVKAAVVAAVTAAI